MAEMDNRYCDCQQCSRGKSSSQPAAAVQPISVPQWCFSLIHIDLVGPLPIYSTGFCYLFIVKITPHIRWKLCHSRLSKPLFLCGRLGDSLDFLLWHPSDHHLRPQPTILLWAVDHFVPLARDKAQYHYSLPSTESNGMVQRTHRPHKDSLSSWVAGEKWPEHLSLVLLGLRAASKDSDGISLAELAYSAPLTLPGQILYCAELPIEIFMKQLLKIEPQPTRPLSYAQAAATVLRHCYWCVLWMLGEGELFPLSCLCTRVPTPSSKVAQSSSRFWSVINWKLSLSPGWSLTWECHLWSL
jgi:hypothetical protein